ncbi:MFS transporter [Allonocardiopsis opalescens]|uniref:Na+/melibiose symporter-like transporter n=1 Tax=Allonocardiopsis opalescens TaxID=1144618 RepID=A0A2T0Q7I5_9ACTN|nr:MFS transporter [Allonocardiopsis opalescens]PRX99762.1 Na+/melibiose symporter-like transporter [Allonocardiopsis opalescens]
MSTEPVGVPVAPETAEPQPRPVTGWFMFVYTLTNFGLSLSILMPTLFTLAYKIQVIAPATRESSLGLVIGIGALVGFLAGPVIGVLSDGTRLRWGRRRPYLVGGVAILAVGAVMIGTASSVGPVLLGWAVSQIGVAFASTAVTPVLAEWVPETQRGRLGGLAGVAAQLAGVAASLVGSLLLDQPILLFLLPVLVLGGASVLFLLTLPDRPAPHRTERASVLRFVKDLAFDPVRHKDFSLVLVGKFLTQLGVNAFSTYQLYFLLERLGMTPEQAGQNLALLGGIGVLVATGSAVVSGLVSDRIKRRKPFIYLSTATTALALVVVAFAPNLPAYALGTTLLVFGSGMFGAVDLALASDVMPERDTKAGKYMAIYNLAGGPAGALAPILAPLVLATGDGSNYTALFVCAAVVLAGSGITAIQIRSVR